MPRKPNCTEPELLVPPPDLGEEERHWGLNQFPMAREFIKHAHVIEPPSQPKSGSESFRVALCLLPSASLPSGCL